MTLWDLVARLLRPLAASALMALAVTSVPESGSGMLVDLIAKILVGVATYCAALLLAWRVAGSPDGAERFFLDQLRARLKR